MTKSTFNISERRGMIAIIGILLTIIITLFIFRTINTTDYAQQHSKIDSIARELQLQVDTYDKSSSEKKKTSKKNKKNKPQKKNKYTERNPLDELLPTN